MTYISPDITTESLTESIVRGIDTRYYNNEILYISIVNEKISALSIVDEKISVLLPDGNEFIIFIKEV